MYFYFFINFDFFKNKILKKYKMCTVIEKLITIDNFLEFD